MQEVTWTVYGIDWLEQINLDISSQPVEVATRCVEQAMLSIGDNELDFGIFLELEHSKMKSENEHLIVLSSAVLANAGYHEEAKSIEYTIDKYTGKNTKKD